MTNQAPSSLENITDTIVGGHFKVGKKLGEGSFGVIFEGIDLLTNQQVAIKFEPKSSEALQLKDEYSAYKIMFGSVGVPNVYYLGQNDMHHTLVMDLLGPSLEELFDLCGRQFSVKTVAMLAIQMISRIQSIHERDLIYRDIKPDNFLVGLPGTDKEDQIFVIDFGMAKLYRDKMTKRHIPYQEQKNLSGTARYMSINTHLGREQSRRDDLEALGHVFLYFLRGSLPWQGIKAATNRLKYEKIGEKKQSTPIQSLCETYPNQLVKYIQYTRKLGFDETPDYDWMRKLFYEILRDIQQENDGIYDWIELNKEDWQNKIKAKKEAKEKNKPLMLEAPPLLPPHQDIINLASATQPMPMKRRQSDYGTSMSKIDDCKINFTQRKTNSSWRKFKSILTCGIF